VPLPNADLETSRVTDSSPIMVSCGRIIMQQFCAQRAGVADDWEIALLAI